ncbi:hypothetical protein EBR96_02605 [bacterium]|nr:hypothetical protein [bacterium]
MSVKDNPKLFRETADALNLIGCDPTKIPVGVEQNLGLMEAAIRHLELISIAAEIGASKTNPVDSGPLPTAAKSVWIIATGHPCNAKPADEFPILGQIRELAEATDIVPASDTQVDSTLLILLKRWREIGSDPGRRTVNWEVKHSNRLLTREIVGWVRALRTIPGFSKDSVQFLKWAGLDADRSNILPWSQTYTVGMGIDAMTRFYEDLIFEGGPEFQALRSQRRQSIPESDGRKGNPVPIGRFLTQLNSFAQGENPDDGIAAANEALQVILNGLTHMKAIALEVTGLSKALAAIPRT